MRPKIYSRTQNKKERSVKMEKNKYDCFKDLPKALTVQQFAAAVGLSKSTDYRIVEMGKIKSVRLSERRRIILKEDFLE